MPGGVVQVTPEGAIVRANAEAQRILGLSYDELTERYVADFEPGTCWEDGTPCAVADYPVSRAIVENRAQPPVTIGVRKPDGETSWAIFTAIPLPDPATGACAGVIVTFVDITERRRIEHERRHSLEERERALAQKLESLGVLSGGIAHDFNNLLQVVAGRLSLARSAVPSGHVASGHLEAADEAARRARDLTQQLLTFAKGGTPIRETVSMASMLEEMSRFALSGSNAGCETHLAPDLWAADVDPSQTFQALQNLVSNAAQAMPGGGVVTLSAENAVVTRDAALPLEAGRYVRITVTDQGVGIAPADLERVFDPYFTTKATGTGLGLAITYSVVRRHGGHVSIASALGKGTTVTLYLPAAASAAPAAATELPPAIGTGRVLVVDDDEDVRDVAIAMIEALGYEAHGVREGGQAIEAYRAAAAAGRAFDAVLVDLTIRGGMGGREAVEKLRAEFPAVRAIVSSGYSNDPVMSEFERHGFCDLVTKPYDLTRLGETLQRVLRR